MNTISKQFLAGSVDGRLIKVAASGSSGTLIHTAVTGALHIDEVWLYAANNSPGEDLKLTIEWGSVSSPDDLIKCTVAHEDGYKLIVPGLPIQNSLPITAYAATGSQICIGGFVNRINCGFQPTDIPGCILWLPPSRSAMTLNGADVAVWWDQSGNGNDATQAVTADQPAYSAAGGYHGRCAVDFDIANAEWMDLTGMSDASKNLTILACLKDGLADRVNTSFLISWHQYGGAMVGTGIACGVGISDEGTGNPVIIGAKETNPATSQMLTWWIDDLTKAECFRDGVSIGSVVPATSQDIGVSVALGQTHPTWASAYHFDGQLSELVIYNTALGAADLAAVTAYMMR